MTITAVARTAAHEAAEAAASVRPAARNRVSDVILGIMSITFVVAVYGAVTLSAPVLLTAGVATALLGLSFALFSPVVPTSGK
ncbi:MAG: hypothetical protein QM708_06415 [Propioniciclava sp.]|uniref:hypothetical protein n=1 Tax=Propioniciclava sp. TaxID=2038686 RepID=UPI0039E36B07